MKAQRDSPSFVNRLSNDNLAPLAARSGLKFGLASEHGTSDCEEPVSNRAKGAGMTVASAPERPLIGR
jgi:hypothetical protein